MGGRGCQIMEGFLMEKQSLSAKEALEKLKKGNKRYMEVSANPGDISAKLRKDTCLNGQNPYAVIITCSDSRVIPEGIFTAGIGELFVIRVAGDVSVIITNLIYQRILPLLSRKDESVGQENFFMSGGAGNVMDRHQIGSVEYGAEHLGCKLVVVLGHDHCGAVGAAIHDEPSGFVKFITDEIRRAIGDEKDEFKASCLNVKQSVSMLKESLKFGQDGDVKVVGAIYHIEDGAVEFLD